MSSGWPKTSQPELILRSTPEEASNESEIVSEKKAKKKQKESNDTPDTGLKNTANRSKQTKVS